MLLQTLILRGNCPGVFISCGQGLQGRCGLYLLIKSSGCHGNNQCILLLENVQVNWGPTQNGSLLHSPSQLMMCQCSLAASIQTHFNTFGIIVEKVLLIMRSFFKSQSNRWCSLITTVMAFSKLHLAEWLEDALRSWGLNSPPGGLSTLLKLNPPMSSHFACRMPPVKQSYIVYVSSFPATGAGPMRVPICKRYQNFPASPPRTIASCNGIDSNATWNC